jgi:hypothetical protein
MGYLDAGPMTAIVRSASGDALGDLPGSSSLENVCS